MANLLPEALGVTPAILLIIASFFTSALTASAGIGGGLALLALMSYALPAALIIPVHGVVQLGSNAGRTYIQRANVHWPTVFRFLLGAAAGASIGAAIVVSLPTGILLTILAIFILLTLWARLPGIPGDKPLIVVLGGLITTFLSMFVGASGPLSALFLERLFADRRHLVATHAAAMTTQHGFKVLAFTLAGFALFNWLPFLALMIASGYAGTRFGTHILERLPEASFRRLFKLVLTVIALDMLRRGITAQFMA